MKTLEDVAKKRQELQYTDDKGLKDQYERWIAEHLCHRFEAIQSTLGSKRISNADCCLDGILEAANEEFEEEAIRHGNLADIVIFGRYFKKAFAPVYQFKAFLGLPYSNRLKRNLL